MGMGQEKRNAVELKSGNVVSHSAPVLSQPTRPATAGRKPEASLVSAKSGREFEGGALIGGAAAVPFSSLDIQKNNRDKSAAVPRARGCGTMTLRGASETSTKFVRSTCKCWHCGRCGPIKARRYCKAIGRLAEEHKLNILLTLTLDPKKIQGIDSTRYINGIFAHFRTYLKRELQQSPDYIRVLEYQPKSGNAHLHILLNRRIRQTWISEAWSALGGGQIVDIRRVKMRSAARYLSKYLTKQMVLNAPKRARRVTTSRGIKLNPKTHTALKWEHINFPINRLHEIYWKTAENVSYDAEGKVTAFDLPNTAPSPTDISITPATNTGQS